MVDMEFSWEGDFMIYLHKDFLCSIGSINFEGIIDYREFMIPVIRYNWACNILVSFATLFG
jgi:hypothetical protein